MGCWWRRVTFPRCLRRCGRSSTTRPGGSGWASEGVRREHTSNEGPSTRGPCWRIVAGRAGRADRTGRTTMRRWIGAAAIAATWLAAAAPGAAASSLLPDLGMAKLSTITIDTTTMPGHRLLRYTAVMVNVGAGPLELVGSRPDTSTPDMQVVQRISNSSGGSTTTPVATTMFYAGDGHNHWHTKDIEGGHLSRLDNGRKVGTLVKEGFCFFDNVKYRLSLPGAPQTAHYGSSSCAPNQPDALTTTMGLSVGWGDSYPYTTNLQWIDITGLPNGKYRLTATADPGHVVQESSYTDNSVWAKIKIAQNRVTVIKYGPGI